MSSLLTLTRYLIFSFGFFYLSMNSNFIFEGVLFLKQDSLIFSPSTATAGQPFSIIIQAKDQNDNIISSTPQSQLNISFSPPGYVSGGCSSSSGRINCTYSFNVSRLYQSQSLLSSAAIFESCRYIVTIQTVNMPATSLTPQTIDVLHSMFHYISLF